MDPAPHESSGQRSSGRGGKGHGGRPEGKGHGGKRLGMKTASPVLLPPPPPPSSSPVPTLPRSTSAPAPPLVPPPLSSAPAAPTVSPRPPQGAGWGAMLPNFPSQHGNQVRPPGGYLNLLQQPQYPPQPHMQGENFHLVGQAMSFNPISPPPPPPPPSAYGTETSQAVKQGNSTKETVNIDIEEGDNSEANIVVKKRYWSHEEEERLASAWLNASKDPIHGNDKRGDTFWKEVTDVFKKKGNGKRRREINQLKVHWSRLKSSISDFNDYWTKVTQIHTSGYSDDMLEKEAHKMYANRFGKPFPLVHWWKILKEEPKWCAQFQMERDKTEIVDIPEEHSRPIGREAAKAERNGKHKKENVIEGIVILGDNIEKIIKVQQDRKVEREKVTEAQIQISNANLKAAKEQKEAKMFEVYNSLLNQDTSHMSKDQKASRDKALRKLEEKLFAD